ncbi:MAG: DUF1294 domain-containing protein [Rubripirellula sp.]
MRFSTSILTALAIWTLVASLVTAWLYARDKRAAGRKDRRTPEKTLLIWSLVGGWPGGLIASRLLRHKTYKLSYRIPFVACVIVNVAATVGLIWLTSGSVNFLR